MRPPTRTHHPIFTAAHLTPPTSLCSVRGFTQSEQQLHVRVQMFLPILIVAALERAQPSQDGYDAAVKGCQKVRDSRTDAFMIHSERESGRGRERVQ